MTHRDRLQVAAGSLTPRLLASAGSLAGVLLLVGLTLGVVGAWIDDLLGWAAVLLGLVSAVALVLPVQFLLAIQTRDGVGPGAAVRTVRGRWRRVLAAELAAFGVAVGAGVAVAAVVLVGHTVVRYLEYAGGRIVPPSPWPVLYLLLAGGALGFWTVLAFGRDAAFLAVFEDRNPWTAWAGSIGTVRLRPRSELVQVALHTLTFGVALVATLQTARFGGRFLYALGRGGPEVAQPLVVASAVALAVGTVGLASAAAIRAAYLEEFVGPPGRPALQLRNVRPVAVAAVVLVAATAGAGAVRTADVGVGPGVPEPLPTDPTEARAVAIENTLTQDHRRVLNTENESDVDATTDSAESYAIDYADRRLRLAVHGYGTQSGHTYTGGLFGEGIYATHLPVRADEGVTAEDWLRVRRVPAFGLAARGVFDTGIDGSVWRLANRTGDRLVYRVDDPAAIGSLVSDRMAGTRGGLAEGSRAVLVVDREAGVVETVRYRLRSRETGHVYLYNTSYEDVGNTDVERPPSLGPRDPIEWTWDLLYY